MTTVELLKAEAVTAIQADLEAAVAASAAAAATSETNAGNSAAAAAASETAAAASASEAGDASISAADSKTAAALSETSAAQFETLANTAQLAAQNSAANAAGSESNAATSEANAGASATSAAASEATATTQAGIATTKAAEAGASATTALNAISQAFRGGVAGASVPATSTATGDTYRITSAGTSQGKTWVIGDAAIYNGTSGSWTQLTGFFAGATAYTDTLVLQRVGSDQIVCDGVTSNRAQSQTPGTRGNLAGAAAATWRCVVTWPTTNPSGSTAVIAKLGGIISPDTENNSLLILLTTGGHMWVNQRGASSSDYRRLQSTTFLTNYGGKTGVFEVAFTFGSTPPVIRWNDTDITSEFTDSSTGTMPDWLDANMVTTNHLTGVAWAIGPAPVGCWVLGPLSSDDRTYWRSTGKPPAWVVRGGTMANATPSGITLSVGAADGVTLPTGVGSGGGGTTNSAVAGTRTGGSGAYVMRIESNGVNSMVEYGNWGNLRGRKLFYRFWARRVSGAATSVIFGVTDEFGFTNNTVSGLTTSWQQFTGFAWGRGPGSGGLNIGVASAAAGEQVEFDDIEVFPAGALSLSLIQPSFVVGDWSAIGGNPGRLVGMTPVTTKRDNELVLSAYAYTTSTSVQLLGGTILDGIAYRIVSVTGNSSASVNLSLGTSSGGTQIVNAQAVNGNFDISTFASRITTGTSLYLTFSGNTTASIKIKFERL